MPKATQRHVSFFDLHVRATPEGGPARSIAQLAPFLIERAKSGRASADYAKGDLCYWIQDAEISDAGKSLLLLIHVADKLASDAAFANPEERTIRYARKRINEGRNWSAHLIISLTPQADNPRSYLALLEDIPGLSHHRVQLLLNKVFSYIAEEHEAQFQYPHPDGSKKDGKPRQRKFRPLVEFRGHLSNTFAEDLAVGKLQGDRPRDRTRSGGGMGPDRLHPGEGAHGETRGGPKELYR